MTNNLIIGTPSEDFPCFCVTDNLMQASVSQTDLFSCPKCGFKFWHNQQGMSCPKCDSRLVQGSATGDKVAELKRVFAEFTFENVSSPINSRK